MALTQRQRRMLALYSLKIVEGVRNGTNEDHVQKIITLVTSNEQDLLTILDGFRAEQLQVGSQRLAMIDDERAAQVTRNSEFEPDP